MPDPARPWEAAPIIEPAGQQPWAAAPIVQPQTVDLRRPQQPAPAQPSDAQPSGFIVNVLGRQYQVDAPTQEAANAAAGRVAERVGAMRPPDPTVPQVPNEDYRGEIPWEEQVDAAIIDGLGRELWTQSRQDRPWVQKVGDWTRDLLQGVTLGAGDEIVAGIDQLIPGGMNYDERLAWEQQQLAAHRAESPVMSTVTEIAGGLPWLATPGALPSRSRSFGQNVARSSVNAAAIGGAYGALGTDGGARERFEGATTGGALGLGIGAGIPALGRLISPAFNAARAVLPNADRTLVNALRESGTTGPDAAAMLRRNPNLNLADIDPNAMSLAQGIAAQPGEGRSIITNAINLRREQAPDRVTGIFDQGMGPTPDVYQTLEGMRTTARTNADQGFGQALGGAGPVDLSQVIAAIDARLFPGGVRPQNWVPLTAQDAELASLRNRLTGGGGSQVTDPHQLHAMQSEMREDAWALGRSATGSDRRTGNAINNVRQGVIDAIDTAAGGQYRPAQAQYATDMSIREAFDRGFEVLQNPTAGEAAMEARPEFWREWVNNLTPDELEAARLGARAAVDTAIESARNAAARGAAVTDVGFNYDRLVILFGQDEADRMATLLADEQLMAQSGQRLLGGSQTEMRRQGVEATAVRPVFTPGSTAGTSVLGVAAGYMAGQGQLMPAIGLGVASALNTGRRYLGSLMDQARNAELANVLMASGPDAQARLGNLISPLSMRSLMQPNRAVELGLAPARTAVPALTGY